MIPSASDSLRLFASLFILAGAGCANLSMLSKPVYDETTISLSSKGRNVEPTPGQGGTSASNGAKEPVLVGGAPSIDSAKTGNSLGASKEAPNAEATVKAISSPSNLKLASVMTAGQVTDLLYWPEDGLARWEIEASKGGMPIRLAKATLSYQSTAKHVSSSLEMAFMGTNEIREKGTPVKFELTQEESGLPKSLAPGDKRSIEVLLKSARTLNFMKANPTVKEFEFSLELFDESGSSLKSPQGGTLKLSAIVSVL